MRQSRFQLKCPSGWFAAGREVATAMQLLSDGTFKLFVWLCLHAERNRGTVSATPAELAWTLSKNEHEVCLALEELERQGVCSLNAEGVIEIRDRFWPYQRHCKPIASDESQPYVEEVKRLFLQRRCVQSSFTAADEKLAVSLFRRGIPLLQVEHAILLGAARKYGAISQHGPGTPISSLHYFADLFEEVRRQGTSPGYWTYIARKVKTFERTWGSGLPAPNAQKPAPGGQRGGYLWVDRPSTRRSKAILTQCLCLKK
jgi:hypothetical protein